MDGIKVVHLVPEGQALASFEGEVSAVEDPKGTAKQYCRKLFSQHKLYSPVKLTISSVIKFGGG
jgi:hypothetical protein